MSTYFILLKAHSGIRWIVLLALILSILFSIVGLIGKKPYGKKDNIFAAAFVGSMHLQLLLGLILYFISPITQSAFQDFGAAMKDATLRFWAVEHLTVMILAVVIAQIGRTKSKRKSESVAKFKSQLIFFGIALVLVLWGIPWERM